MLHQKSLRALFHAPLQIFYDLSNYLFWLQMLETYWSSELSQLQEMQKREYREWVTKVHEDMVRVSSGWLVTLIKTNLIKSSLMSTFCQTLALRCFDTVFKGHT